jgi:hypothetical protein
LFLLWQTPITGPFRAVSRRAEVNGRVLWVANTVEFLPHKYERHSGAQEETLPGNITLEYRTNGGLFNQHIGHAQALMLAVSLGVRHFRWPPLHDRETYAKKGGLQEWAWTEASDIYDIAGIQKYFQGKCDGQRATAVTAIARLWHRDASTRCA